MNKPRCRFNNNTGEWEEVITNPSAYTRALMGEFDRAFMAGSANRAKREADLNLRFSNDDWCSSIPEISRKSQREYNLSISAFTDYSAGIITREEYEKIIKVKW